MVFVRRLDSPTDDQLEQCVHVLLDAFNASDDKIIHSLTGGDRSLDIYLHRAAVRAGALGGQIWVAGFDESVSQICAVAIWFPPGSGYLVTEEQRAAGWYEAKSKFTPELDKWYTEYFVPQNVKWGITNLGKDTVFNSWHLQFLATSPKHQKKGLSAALMEAIEPLAEADNVPMFLETTNAPNVRFYTNRGFRIRGELTVVGAGGQHTRTSMFKP